MSRTVHLEPIGEKVLGASSSRGEGPLRKEMIVRASDLTLNRKLGEGIRESLATKFVQFKVDVDGCQSYTQLAR